MGGRASLEVRRRASAKFYAANRDAIRAKRREQDRANPRKKDLTTPKERARSKLRYAVWSGKITKPSVCDDCGSGSNIQGHHDDYSQPLAVRWLCATCHAAVHAAERRGPRLEKTDA
jgi:ribosomal protein S27AE